MVENCFVHIGFHKTGSTSIQHFLLSNRKRLSDLGICFYNGRHIHENHVELHASTMRAGRESTFRSKSGLTFDKTYLDETRAQVSTFIDSINHGTALFSAEGLSLLRHVDEVALLASMLPANTQIIAYTRNIDDDRRSHIQQFEKSGIELSDDPDCYTYMTDDSWMLDYDLRLPPYRQQFGHENVHVIDYDKVFAVEQGVIPSFLSTLGIRDKFNEDD